MKKRFIVFISFIILLALLAFAGFLFLKNIKAPVASSKEEAVRIEIPSGISVSGAANLLSEKGLIRNAKLFYYVARYPALKKFLFRTSDDTAFVLRSGIYYISPSMDIVEIQNILASGQQEYIKVSLPEGLEMFYKTLEDSIYNCMSLEEVKRFYS